MFDPEDGFDRDDAAYLSRAGIAPLHVLPNFFDPAVLETCEARDRTAGLAEI